MFNKNRKQGPIAMPIKYEELDSARPSREINQSRTGI